MLERAVLKQLEHDLGKANVVTAVEELVCYAYDATAEIPRCLPDAVVTPEKTGDVAALVKIASEHRIPLYPRGSGTNLSGGTVPVKGGIVVSLLKMRKILETDPENMTATVQPGVVIQELNEAVAPYGLIYPPDPGTVATATMGGSVAECSGGLRGLKYGVTKHYVMGLEVVMASGQILKAGGKTVKNVTGYDLVGLFTGSEGTLGIITEITVKVIPAPAARRSMLAFYSDQNGAARSIAGIISSKVIPATLEIMDHLTVHAVENYAHVGLPLEAEAVLLIEVDGPAEVVEGEALLVAEICRGHGGVLRVAGCDGERDQLWAARRAALPALARLKPTTVLEDATVPRSKVPDMLAALRKIAEKHNLSMGTFGHAGDGNLHPTILCDDSDPEEMTRVHQAVDDIFAVALSLGGTLSGEHGIGLAKMKYLKDELGSCGLDVLRKIKFALDPHNIFNPGKIIPGEID
ncbi:MAG: FAD-binding oxidoreductase [Bacillota bacterium]